MCFELYSRCQCLSQKLKPSPGQRFWEWQWLTSCMSNRQQMYWNNTCIFIVVDTITITSICLSYFIPLCKAHANLIINSHSSKICLKEATQTFIGRNTNHPPDSDRRWSELRTIVSIALTTFSRVFREQSPSIYLSKNHGCRIWCSRSNIYIHRTYTRCYHSCRMHSPNSPVDSDENPSTIYHNQTSTKLPKIASETLYMERL